MHEIVNDSVRFCFPFLTCVCVRCRMPCQTNVDTAVYQVTNLYSAVTFFRAIVIFENYGRCPLISPPFAACALFTRHVDGDDIGRRSPYEPVPETLHARLQNLLRGAPWTLSTDIE